MGMEILIKGSAEEIATDALAIATAYGAIPSPKQVLEQLSVSEVTDYLRAQLPEMTVRIVAKESADVPGTDEEQGSKETPPPPSQSKKKRSRKKAAPAKKTPASEATGEATPDPFADNTPADDIANMSTDELRAAIHREWFEVHEAGEEGEQKVAEILEHYGAQKFTDIHDNKLAEVLRAARKTLAELASA